RDAGLDRIIRAERRLDIDARFERAVCLDDLAWSIGPSGRWRGVWAGLLEHGRAQAQVGTQPGVDAPVVLHVKRIFIAVLWRRARIKGDITGLAAHDVGRQPVPREVQA